MTKRTGTTARTAGTREANPANRTLETIMDNMIEFRILVDGIEWGVIMDRRAYSVDVFSDATGDYFGLGGYGIPTVADITRAILSHTDARRIDAARRTLSTIGY